MVLRLFRLRLVKIDEKFEKIPISPIPNEGKYSHTHTKMAGAQLACNFIRYFVSKSNGKHGKSDKTGNIESNSTWIGCAPWTLFVQFAWLYVWEHWTHCIARATQFHTHSACRATTGQIAEIASCVAVCVHFDSGEKGAQTNTDKRATTQ